MVGSRPHPEKFAGELLKEEREKGKACQANEVLLRECKNEQKMKSKEGDDDVVSPRLPRSL